MLTYGKLLTLKQLNDKAISISRGLSQEAEIAQAIGDYADMAVVIANLEQIAEYLKDQLEYVENDLEWNNDLADAQITLEENIASFIFKNGESVLNDEGVDEDVCADLGRTIFKHIVSKLEVEELVELKIVMDLE